MAALCGQLRSDDSDDCDGSSTFLPLSVPSTSLPLFLPLSSTLEEARLLFAAGGARRLGHVLLSERPEADTLLGSRLRIRKEGGRAMGEGGGEEGGGGEGRGRDGYNGGQTGSSQ